MSAVAPEEADHLDGVAPPEQAAALHGHDVILRQLQQQLVERRLPGAVLLHGPLGIGKATFAFAFAREVLTKTGDEDAARVNEQISGGVHPNVFTLRRKPRDTGNGFYAAIRVEDIRDLQKKMRRTRGRAGYRLCVVDSIDDCNISAANALLKILEEPPEETLFLLISHRPGSLLPTIRSRCHAYAFRSLSAPLLEAVLRQQAEGADDDTMRQAVTLAAGRPRRGFEALVLEQRGALEALEVWLASPAKHPVADHLTLADTLAKSSGAETAFAREMMVNRFAGEAQTALAAAAQSRNRLASATQLWEKATTMFSDADTYNLDARQTLVSIFDAFRQHDLMFAASRSPLDQHD